MKTKKIMIILIAFVLMSHIGNKTTANDNSTSASLIETSIDDTINCNSGFYNVYIEWVNSPTIAEKNAIRASFDIYGRSPIFQIFSDGTERWVFNLDNMNPSVVVIGVCRSTTVENEVDDHEEVDTMKEVRQNNR